MLCKNELHELRTPADFIGTECRKCHDGRQTKYKTRRGQAMALFRALEARGIDVHDLNKAERILVAAAALQDVMDFKSGRAQLALQRDPELCRAAVALADELGRAGCAV